MTASLTGVGVTSFGRQPGPDSVEWQVTAAHLALADAGVDPDAVDTVITGYSTVASHLMPANLFAERFGIRPAMAFGMSVGGCHRPGDARPGRRGSCRPARPGTCSWSRGGPGQRPDPRGVDAGPRPGRPRALRGAARRHGAGVLRAARLALPLDLRPRRPRRSRRSRCRCALTRPASSAPSSRSRSRSRTCWPRGRSPSRCGCSTAARSRTAGRRSSCPPHRPASARSDRRNRPGTPAPAPVRAGARGIGRRARRPARAGRGGDDVGGRRRLRHLRQLLDHRRDAAGGARA